MLMCAAVNQTDQIAAKTVFYVISVNKDNNDHYMYCWIHYSYAVPIYLKHNHKIANKKNNIIVNLQSESVTYCRR